MYFLMYVVSFINRQVVKSKIENKGQVVETKSKRFVVKNK